MTAAYGSWKSPITSEMIAAGTVNLDGPILDEDIFWLEGRPLEGGRTVLVRRAPDGKATELTPAPFDVRSRVHEYGGGAYAVSKSAVFFCHFAGQRLYRLEPGETPHPITPDAAYRYADITVDNRRNLLFCVREDHSEEGEAVNTLVKIRCQGDEAGGTVIASGNDFYSSPRLRPDGSQLTWLTWNWIRSGAIVG